MTVTILIRRFQACKKQGMHVLASPVPQGGLLVCKCSFGVKGVELAIHREEGGSRESIGYMGGFLLVIKNIHESLSLPPDAALQLST